MVGWLPTCGRACDQKSSTTQQRVARWDRGRKSRGHVDVTVLKAGQRIVVTNGIRMHIAEQGSGLTVLLCHGFPECWYSWRHQLTALAEAGFRAIAPDMRGYGQPKAVLDATEKFFQAFDVLASAFDTPLRSLRLWRASKASPKGLW
jgi:alpha-beta hydrolase superfamily lysophospholipase